MLGGAACGTARPATAAGPTDAAIRTQTAAFRLRPWAVSSEAAERRLSHSSACGRGRSATGSDLRCPVRRRGSCVAAAAGYGSEPFMGDTPRAPRQRKPEWVRILEEDADNDPEVAELLEGTGGDPDKIREKMKHRLKQSDVHREDGGTDVPPNISFRAISPLGLWVWLQFAGGPPTPGEQELLEGVLRSWFAVGKLGGYNSQNLQVYQNADDDQSFFEYDNDELGVGENRMASYMHDMGDIQYQDDWARVWIDLGTADELSLDVLLNTLVGFSAQMCALKAITLGGANEDWPLPEGWEGDASGLGPDDEFMQATMDPMRLPEGLDEEFQFMDEEGMLEGGKGRPQAAAAAGSGYGVDAGEYGATAEERELQQLAARLRRPQPAGSGTAVGGYYGASKAPGVDLDIDPDEYRFTDQEEQAAGEQISQAPTQQLQRPWGASFVRRVKRQG
uniref:CGL70p n=1 Tax=Chlamydomonas reinhardtii TaxID=3055 RepID=D5LAV5_CHLRE|nr:CGL70p [Chlamydomonas reinhardtii]